MVNPLGEGQPVPSLTLDTGLDLIDRLGHQTTWNRTGLPFTATVSFVGGEMSTIVALGAVLVVPHDLALSALVVAASCVVDVDTGHAGTK
jgi:hypothetical protein